MECASSSQQGRMECSPDFGFAFNNDKFSDRTIQLNIITEIVGPINNITLANWVRKHKRCRLNISTATENNGDPSTTDYSSTKTIYISTPILAARSPFFYKLFSNGMAESNQQLVTLQIHESDTVQSLKDAAKEFLVAHFKDMRNDDLQVSFEDEIYDFVMTWARKNNIKKTREQREILIMRLLRLVRFPFLSRNKLEEVLTCTLISLEHRSKLVFDAISLETPYRQLPPVKEQERAYKLRPVKVIRFDSPCEKCVVYLDLKHEECACLLPSDGIYSQPFDLAGQTFYLNVLRHVEEQSSVHSFGFFLGKKENGSLGIEFEFSSIIKPSEEFVGLCETYYDFTEAGGFGCPDLFDEPWERIIEDDSPYFVNGVLHLRAVIKIKKEV